MPWSRINEDALPFYMVSGDHHRAHRISALKQRPMPMRTILSAFLCGTLLAAEAAFAGGTIGRTIGVNCNACHGPDGKSQGAIPSLDGLSAKQIESAVLAFKLGERQATVMNRIAKGYTDNEIAAIAEYFANLQ